MTSTKCLIVYDKNGTIIRNLPADCSETPEGIPYIIVDVPYGVSIKSIDVTTNTPVWDIDNAIIPEMNKLSAKVDYAAMMSGIDMSNVCNVLEGNMNQITEIDSTTNHSKNYDKVYYYYVMGLWNATALVHSIGKWVTQNEYTTIVKAKEEKTVASMDGAPVIIAKGE